MHRGINLVAATIVLCGIAGIAQAQVKSGGTFDLYLKGVRAATLTVSGSETASAYSVAGSLQSAGLVGLIKTMKYDASAKGSVRNGQFHPSAYAEDADTGKRQSQARMSYSGGVPKVTSYVPPRSPRDADRDVAADTQGGTLDPLTTIFAGLRDTPADQLCKFDRFMFDGRRRSHVTLSNPTRQGENVVCQGRYQRIAGFSQREMAEKTDFRFTLTYGQAGQGMMRVNDISMDTIYGKASLRRR